MMRLKLILIVLTLLPTSVMARDRAVLVGVGDYLYLDADLQGPVNDVGLMANALMRRGIAAADIVALVDANAPLPSTVSRGLPDRVAILDALSAAIQSSGQGDTVIFYFSGHGTQAPDTNGDEGGGPDEIFLPRDAKGWNGTLGLVENAIVDDEFSELAAMAVSRDVKLVAILDACHSGTGFRALNDADSRARYIAPDLLGIPDTLTEVPENADAVPNGDYVFLYAAQSDQRAFEYPVGDDRIWHGDFTRAIAAVLSEVADLNYGTLVAAASQQMRVNGGQAAQTPDAEGTMLTSPVIGANSAGLNRISVEGTTLMAGALQNVTNDSEILLFSGLLDTEPVGRASVTSVQAAQSEVTYLEPFPTVRVTHAEISRRAIDSSFSVGFSKGALSQLEQLFPGGPEDLRARVDFTIHGPTAAVDHRIVWTGTEFALVGRDGILDADGPGSSPRLVDPAIDAQPMASMAENLTANAGRVRLERALAQIAKGGGPTGFALFPTGPEVRFAHQPSAEKGGRCRNSRSTSQQVEGSITATHCDVLSVKITNPTSSMQDITVLYVDGTSRIDVLWPRSGLSNRLESGGEKQLSFGLRFGGPPNQVLNESLIVLSVPAQPGSTRTVFAGLGTGGRAKGASGPMASFLNALTDPAGSTRSLSFGSDKVELSLDRLDVLLTSGRGD